MATAPRADGATPSSLGLMQVSIGHLAPSRGYEQHAAATDPSGPVDVPPNPPFVFPARSELPSTASFSEAHTLRRRPMSAIEPVGDHMDILDGYPGSHSDFPALPAFSFNPGASLPPDPHAAFLNLPNANTPRTIPSPARIPKHGHRRGGSEFVGGRLRDGNSISVLGTSPTKSEAGMPSPKFPPPRRAHRRGISSAMSATDLPTIPPPGECRAQPDADVNAATNPANLDHAAQTLDPATDDRVASPDNALSSEDGKPSPSHNYNVMSERDASLTQQVTSASRARVGFSDTLEFIPRPLSLVSSDTSSTMTARLGHSVSASLSNISSTCPAGRESPAPMPRSPTLDKAESRPSTAGAILEGVHGVQGSGGPHTAPKRRNSIPASIDVAGHAARRPLESSAARPGKRWSFFGLESLASSSTPTKHRPASCSSSDSTQRMSSSGSESATESARGTPARKAKSSKGQRKGKMKGWADSILPRKSKENKKRVKSRVARSPTPPALVLPTDEDDDAAFHQDCPMAPSSVPAGELNLTSQQPTVTDDSSYQMIDLDAALGPFNTPIPHNPEWEAAQRAAGNSGKRRLHSAQGMRGFSGPGMHYHRRAESAPDLPPFEGGRPEIHHLGSRSTMDDVFEEDEDEAEGSSSHIEPDAAQQSSCTDSESDSDVTPPAASAKQTGPHTQDPAGLSGSAQSVHTERSNTSLHEDVILEEPAPPGFLTLNLFHAKPGSSSSASASPKRLPYDKDMAPVDVNPIYLPAASGAPISPYSMSHCSSHPSPRSPMSVDAQRMSTAPSSIAEESMIQSLLMGEPGPEVRFSVDYDIPSLTSSTSTTTRDSNLYPRPPQPRSREQRPVSVSSAFGRRRSSLVSLSRLISSSHGERSKLSVEVTLDDDSGAKKRKEGKKSRFGLVKRFWKTKSEDGA